MVFLRKGHYCIRVGCDPYFHRPDDQPAEFQIDDTYSVPGVGTVVSGTTLKGTIKVNETLLLGPDPLGHFAPIAVKSIHRKRMPVNEVRSGQTASFSLKKIKRSQIRKVEFELMSAYGIVQVKYFSCTAPLSEFLLYTFKFFNLSR
jgi:GTPase